MNALTVIVKFESGYETAVLIERATFENSEYWVEITDRQNPYDSLDEVTSIAIAGISVNVDGDGEWMITLENAAREVWDDVVFYS